MNSRRAALRGSTAVLSATVLWGSTGVLVKLTSMAGPVFTLWRVLFGIPILFLATVLQRQKIRSGPIAPCLGAGLLFGVSIVLYFTAMQLTSIANVTLINALTPVLVAIVSPRTLGERVSVKVGVAVAGATAGVVLAVLSSRGLPGRSSVGDLAAVLGLVLFVAYFLLSKHLRGKIPNSRYNLLMTVGALLPASFAFAISKKPLLGYSSRDYLMVALVAIFPGSLGHWLVNWAHTRISASTSATIQLGVPVLAIAAGWLFVGESMGILGIVGSAVTLLAIFAAIRIEASQAGEERSLEESEAIA